MSEDDVLELELELGEGDAGWDDEGATEGVEVGMGCVAGGAVGDGAGVPELELESETPLSFGVFTG